ncbi:MAG: hypothetical protein FVQ82_14935 [Planctomycetes bacterium]|nr:hypothetical protein [Planctomycetota bacterium]
MLTTKKQLSANRQNALKSTGPRTSSGKSITSQNAVTHGLRAQQIVIAGESQDEYNDFREVLIARMVPTDPLETLLVDRIAASFWRLRRSELIEAQIYDNLRQDLITARSNNLPDPLLVTVPVASSVSSSAPSETATLEVRVGIALKSLLKRFLETESNPELASSLLQVEHAVEYFKKHPNTIHITGLLQFLRGLAEISVDSDFISDQDACDLGEAIDELSRIQAEILRENQPNIGHTVTADITSNNVLSKFTRYETQIQSSLFKAMHELERLQATGKGRQVSAPYALDIDITTTS